MAGIEKRNWGLGFLLSIVLAAGMIVNSYVEYVDAQRQCYDCFGEYDFLENDLFATLVFWLGGVLAGLVFHGYVTPAIVRPSLRYRFGFLAAFATILGLLLIVAAAAAYGYANIDLWRNYGQEGPEARPYFSALHLVQDSLKLFMIIALYEVLNELYYFLIARAKENRSLVLKALAEFLLFSAILFLLWYAAMLSFTVMTGNNYSESRFTQLILWILPIVALHLHWFYRCIAIVKNGFTNENRINFLEPLVTTALVVVYLLVFFVDTSNKIWLLHFLIVHALGIGSAYLRSVLISEKRTFLTEVSQTSAELGALRAQINPHFLFNALNTLYAIAMKENSEKTADGIQKLGDMMRFMLQENHQNRIPLAKEIEYLHNLIEIQQLRLDDNQQIDLKINLQNPDREVFIAPMLLNPLVENAFKHGISFRNASWIYITLTHDPEHIFFKVHNSYHPKSELDPEKDSHGIGLDNVRKRLDLLYPDKHEFSIQVSEHDYFVSLILTIV